MLASAELVPQTHIFLKLTGRHNTAPIQQSSSSLLGATIRSTPPSNQKVANMPWDAYPVPTKGDVHIIPEPRAQGNMPTAPELSNTLRHIRVVEIFHKLESKHFPQTNRHIGITAKIKINLEGIRNNTKPGC